MPLNPRQRRIDLFRRVIRGETRKDIARELGLSLTRVAQIVQKAADDFAHAIHDGSLFDTPEAVWYETEAGYDITVESEFDLGRDMWSTAAAFQRLLR